METNTSKHMRERIVGVFIELLHTRTFAHVTINDICDKAEISRSTFYRHYSDIYGLLEGFILHIHNETSELAKGRSRYDAMAVNFEIIEKYKIPLKNMVIPEADGYVYAFMLKFYAEAIYEELAMQEKQGRRFSVSLGFLSDFLSAGLCHVQIKWIKGEYRHDKQELIDDITQLLLRSGFSDHVRS